MRKAIISFFLAGVLLSCGGEKKAEEPMVKDATTTATTADKPQASEFADPKYVDMGKKYMSLLSAGKIDEWAAQFDDNAVYQWSAGDSLAGKAAITNYWKDRMTKVIDKISFINDIWLPIKVNQPQQGPDLPGVWLINWEQVDVTYKNGKRLLFGVHNDFHYNDAGKIDRVIQYIDRAPINAALGIK